MQTFPNCQVVRPVGVSFLGHPTFFLYWRATEEKQTTQQTMHYWHDSFSHKLLTPVDTEELQMHIQVHNMKLKKVPLSFYPTRIQLIKHGHLYFTHKGKTKTGPGMIIRLMWGEAELLRVLACLLYTKLCLHEHTVCAWKHCRINLYVCFLFDAGKSPSTKHCAY